MANVKKGNVWSIDTLGVITDRPIWIKAITMIPNAAADAMRFDWWNEGEILTSSELVLNATISSSTTLTDTNTSNDKLTSSAFPAGAVLKVISSTGAVANLGYKLIITAGNNDRVITEAITDEATKDYHIIAYQNRTAFQFLSQATPSKMEHITFPGGGIEMPNLTLAVATTAGSTKALLYLA